MATKPKPNAQLCVVRVHHLDLLLPMDQGMKLVALLQHAARVDRDWIDHAQVYIARGADSLDVELALVRSNQVRMPQGELQPGAARRSIGTKPLLLSGD